MSSALVQDELTFVRPLADLLPDGCIEGSCPGIADSPVCHSDRRCAAISSLHLCQGLFSTVPGHRNY